MTDAQRRALRRIRFGSESSLLALRPHFSYTGYWDQQDFKESGYLHVDNHTEWKNGYEVHTGINPTGVTPKGPRDPGWRTPHGRGALGGRPFGDGTPPPV